MAACDMAECCRRAGFGWTGRRIDGDCRCDRRRGGDVCGNNAVLVAAMVIAQLA
jgi:hypothetical protein